MEKTVVDVGVTNVVRRAVLFFYMLFLLSLPLWGTMGVVVRDMLDCVSVCARIVFYRLRCLMRNNPDKT